MTKEIVQCPICKPLLEEEECELATVKRVEGETTYVCCCEIQAKKVKS